MTPCARPRISWHRGGAELAPVGSLAAFEAAAAARAELIEVDVRRTADGRLVCHHDAELPGLGSLAAASLAAARDARGSAVFTLTELLDAVDAADGARTSTIHLDLKETGFEDEAVRAVLARGRRALVTSLEEGSVAVVRRTHPQVPALLSIGRPAHRLGRFGQLRVRAGEVVPFRAVERSGATGVAAHYLLATPALRSWCRWRGLQLLVWTVDGERALERWLHRGDVDVVTTNRPLAARLVREGAA